FTAGMVDAVSILGLGGVFTSLMTGNTVLIGLSLGGGADYASAFRSSLAIAFFLLGAAFGGRWAKRRMNASHRAWLLPMAYAESGLLLAAAVIGYAFARGSGDSLPEDAVSIAIALTAMAMGLRSATITRLSVPDMKTTVLTLTLTGLAADSPLGGNNSQRTLRRIGSVVLLSSGASIGALLYNRWGVAVTLAIMAAIVLGSTLAFSLTAQAKESPKKSG
ncbi:DUF1275 domain-containing protein, partial [Oscillatoriales cyanobacterium LEGE 11467]